MAMTRKFEDEYDSIAAALKSEKFSDEHSQLLKDLRRVVVDDGPDVSAASALDTLRSSCKRGFFTRLLGLDREREADGILSISGEEDERGKRAAALKALRHFYLMSRRGGHTTWVMSLPEDYEKWPSQEMGAASGDQLKNKLMKAAERFSSSQERSLTHCTQQAGSWAQKAAAICSKTSGVGAETAATLIDRWFANDTTTDERKDAIRQKLATGFRQIATCAQSNKLVLTDHPEARGTRYERANAFVYKTEKRQVVYIEEGFFGAGGDPLTGMTNWTRIMVHELSHVCVKTDDVFYRHQGIKPSSNRFPDTDTLRNADSWAFFAADANGQLTDQHRSYCLK